MLTETLFLIKDDLNRFEYSTKFLITSFSIINQYNGVLKN